MNRSLLIIAGFVAVAVLATMLFSFWLVFGLYAGGPRSGGFLPKPTPMPTRTVVPESTPIFPAEIKAADVSSLSIKTVYKDYFEKGSKCRQTYNEMFGEADGVFSAGSPCDLNLTFNRDGSAEKTIAIRRYDKTAKAWREAEKTVWKAKISSAEFDELNKVIVNNDAFKAWNDGISITASNCTITAKYTGGYRSPMSNVDERTTIYLEMVNAFKALDAKTAWEK